MLLYSQKIGGDFTVRSFHSRDLTCLDYPNISAPIGRNICLADAFLCLLLPNDIRVLFPKKSTFIKISLPLYLPNPPRVKDQGRNNRSSPMGEIRTKDEPRNTQRTPNHQKVLFIKIGYLKKSLLRYASAICLLCQMPLSISFTPLCKVSLHSRISAKMSHR